jgi:hypothetical protein
MRPIGSPRAKVWFGVSAPLSLAGGGAGMRIAFTLLKRSYEEKCLHDSASLIVFITSILSGHIKLSDYYLHAHDHVHIDVHVVIVVIIVVVVVIVVIVVVVDGGNDVDNGVEECHRKGEKGELGVCISPVPPDVSGVANSFELRFGVPAQPPDAPGAANGIYLPSYAPDVSIVVLASAEWCMHFCNSCQRTTKSDF